MAERSRWMKVLRVIFLDLKARGSMSRSVSFYKRPKLTLFFIFLFFSKKMVGGVHKHFKTIDFLFFFLS